MRAEPGCEVGVHVEERLADGVEEVVVMSPSLAWFVSLVMVTVAVCSKELFCSGAMLAARSDRTECSSVLTLGVIS